MKNKYEVRGDVTAIFIVCDREQKETLIDTIDFPKAAQFSGQWFGQYNLDTRTYYVHGNTSPTSTPPTTNGKRGKLQLHRWLLETPNHLQVDHKNHDTLNNRRSCNIRNATQAENQQNKKGANANKRSGGALNVYPTTGTSTWNVSMNIGGKQKHCGCFLTKEEAEAVAVTLRAKLKPFSKEASLGLGLDELHEEALSSPDKPYYTSKTGVRGVIQNGSSYVACLRLKNKRHNLGTYATIAEAEKVIKEARNRLINNEAIDDLLSNPVRPRRNSSSGMSGVQWEERSRSWRVQIVHKGVTYWHGYHKDLEEAKRVAIEARIKLGQIAN